MVLSALSDQDLLSDVVALVGSHRELTAKLVAHLSEIEERRLHLLAGYSSMFDFCQKKLGMSEGEAFRRILAARLGRRFPVAFSLLASGSLRLSTLELLREWLTEQNHEELFAAVAGKGKREVQAFLAARFPRPDVRSRIQRKGADADDPDVVADIEPLSATRFRVEFTAGEELRRKLELCRDLMSHANPSRDLAVVIERAVDLLLVELERKRLGRAKRPRGEPTRREGSCSSVTTATRREVFERDGIQCTYVAEDGRRCEARAFLELDHLEPKGLGGSDDAQNLRVRCRAHNQLWAEQAFGRDLVGLRRHMRQRKSTHGKRESALLSTAIPTPSPPSQATAPAIFAKVRLALRSMGFRDAEVRRAIAEVVRTRDGDEPLVVERVLRKAILVATAA